MKNKFFRFIKKHKVLEVLCVVMCWWICIFVLNHLSDAVLAILGVGILIFILIKIMTKK